MGGEQSKLDVVLSLKDPIVFDTKDKSIDRLLMPAYIAHLLQKGTGVLYIDCASADLDSHTIEFTITRSKPTKSDGSTSSRLNTSKSSRKKDIICEKMTIETDMLHLRLIDKLESLMTKTVETGGYVAISGSALNCISRNADLESIESLIVLTLQKGQCLLVQIDTAHSAHVQRLYLRSGKIVGISSDTSGVNPKEAAESRISYSILISIFKMIVSVSFLILTCMNFLLQSKS